MSKAAHEHKLTPLTFGPCQKADPGLDLPVPARYTDVPAMTLPWPGPALTCPWRCAGSESRLCDALPDDHGRSAGLSGLHSDLARQLGQRPPRRLVPGQGGHQGSADWTSVSDERGRSGVGRGEVKSLEQSYNVESCVTWFVTWCTFRVGHNDGWKYEAYKNIREYVENYSDLWQLGYKNMNRYWVHGI